jgi:hypothetical protein
VSFLKSLAAKSETRDVSSVSPLIQSIKKFILKNCSQAHRLDLLNLVKGLESAIEAY